MLDQFKAVLSRYLSGNGAVHLVLRECYGSSHATVALLVEVAQVEWDGRQGAVWATPGRPPINCHETLFQLTPIGRLMTKAWKMALGTMAY
ncbi:hypothetical protein NM688_g6667 [Phlebia brevispora]|uniref:Uncharacterized protein n=1 Tax=Phlebia brevispora TaxID=194682 RepID=A0ACC1SDU3_9APHY|nr:hypothetical protein NM688_g6667 [Phlebia brevispora]